MISVKGGGGENVRPETDEYTALLAEALSEIEGKAALGGNATAEDIREGKTAYVNGQLLEGLMKEGAEYGILYKDIDSSGIPRSIVFNLFDFMNVEGGFNTDIGVDKWGISNIQNAIIKATSIARNQFQSVFENSTAKVKIFANTIGSSAFRNASGGPKYFISKQVTTIIGSSTSPSDEVGPFYNSTDIAIYCEHSSQPSGFGTCWNQLRYGSVITTTWGVTEEQFDAL